MLNGTITIIMKNIETKEGNRIQANIKKNNEIMTLNFSEAIAY